MSPIAPLIVTVAALLQPQSPDGAALHVEISSLREQVRELERSLKERDEAAAEMGRSLKAMAADVGEVRERLLAPAAAFAAAPPPSSDAVGIAKTVVFAPRLEVDSGKRRDIVFLKVKRVDPGRLQPVAEVELGNDGVVRLPLDQNGALYVVEWSTSEGHAYDMVLRDGATGLAAATVQVRPELSRGRFVFVGYGLE
jgi:hypothetical protein